MIRLQTMDIRRLYVYSEVVCIYTHYVLEVRQVKDKNSDK